MAKETPMMKQYKQIKADHQDAFLFFRLGDFYELFLEDAVKAAQELEITLTKRGQGEDSIPMCGVPYHSAEHYITQLIAKGYKIAICEQVEDPRTAKGVVKREVVQLITPGTVMDGKMIDEKENNFIGAVHDFEDGTVALARIDLTTGESVASLLTDDPKDWTRELAGTSVKEVVVCREAPERILEEVKKLGITVSYEDNAEVDHAFHSLCRHVQQDKIIQTYARLTNYLSSTQRRSLDHLQAVEIYNPNNHMQIDVFSKRNLELTETIREKTKKGSLLWLLDKTVTAMGGRLLKRWIEQPLLEKDSIKERHSLVSSWLENFFAREDVRDKLKEVYDLERLCGKVAYGNVNARELVQLKRSLLQVPGIIEIISSLNNEYASKQIESVDICSPLVDLLEKSLVDEPPISIKEGGMIKDGYHEQLDEYKHASRNGKEWISSLEKKEKERTGIKSLKIGYNKVFGYYIEVTKANIPYLEEGLYERKQTLTNAERFITPELKEKEALILEATENIEQLEYDLFLAIRERVKDYLAPLQQLAKIISEIDVLQGFAVLSEEQNYVMPSFSENRKVVIREGRHPVVEQMIERGEYVSNDVTMDKECEMLLITGPNMAGKSTYMRQLALLSIMAQVGCYVPAAKAELPLFDQVFTRIGAADDLAAGQSTFMVEMLETHHALSKATENSLILLDEIGRGTSTYDGMALAQAIIEHIHNNIGAKTLFSTHYHELTALDQNLPRMKNVHVSAMEEDGEVVFLHKVIPGQADRSYGIYVAKLASLPDSVIERAEVILKELEGGQSLVKTRSLEDNEKESSPQQLSLFQEEPAALKHTKASEEKASSQAKGVLTELKKADVLNMSPIQALQTLYDLQQKIKD
nr:DNA mismatch repair protein MutS [Bacillus sp. FJAT-44742]